ncbi:hypothetical protein MASR2M18_06800 [Ignavibacteria bacterium]|jgi:uncharacterized FlaG/YvyC family protein|nr:flagellar protein FlaG [Bacteroidota bacterium]MCZ2131697.1 flagellar protein FlaG [Bacteroidota bacterium]
MTITPLQSATQLTIIQAGDTRTDGNRQRMSGTDLFMPEWQNKQPDNAHNDQAAQGEKKSEATDGASAKEKKLDFSSLSQSLKNSLQLANVAFEFSIDSQTQSMVLRLINPETKEVLQQLPSDLALKISRLIAGSLEQGQITDAKV